MQCYLLQVQIILYILGSYDYTHDLDNDWGCGGESRAIVAYW